MKKLLFISTFFISLAGFSQQNHSATQTAKDSSTKIATTQYVDKAVSVAVIAPGSYFNVRDYGAYGDGKVATDGDMSSGSNILHSAQATFVSGDVGKIVFIHKVGSGGRDTVATITGFTDAHHITINKNSSASVGGCVFRYGHDDTNPIQAAINACYANKGGTVFLPNGMYILGGNLIVTDNLGNNPTSQLYFPSSSFTQINDTAQIAMRFLGETIPFVDFGVLDNDSSQLITNGVILFSALTTSYGTGSVLGNAGAVNTGFGIFSGMKPDVENIFIMVPEGLDGAYRTAFDFHSSIGEHIKNCVAKTDLPGVVTHTPLYLTAGFRFTQKNGGVDVVAEGMLTSGGFVYGYEVSEHLDAFALTAAYCYYGIYYPGGTHQNHISTYKPLWCAYAIYSPTTATASAVAIDQLDMEGLIIGKWYDYIHVVSDVSNHLTGSIAYAFSSSSLSSPTATYHITGGSNLLMVEHGYGYPSLYTSLGALGTRPVSTGFSSYPTAAIVELTTGQTTSTDTKFPWLVLNTAQSGTANILGLETVINRALSSGGEQRMVETDYLTNGATNSAIESHYVFRAGTAKQMYALDGLKFRLYQPLMHISMSTSTMNALTPAAGWEVYNTDTAGLCYYNGSAWLKVTGSGGGGGGGESLDATLTIGNNTAQLINVTGVQTARASINIGTSARAQNYAQGDFFFGENITYNSGYKAVNTGAGSQIYFYNSGANPAMLFQTGVSVTGGSAITLKVPLAVVGNSSGGTVTLGGNISNYTGSGTGGTVQADNADFYPITNNSVNNGKGAQRWANVYSVAANHSGAVTLSAVPTGTGTPNILVHLTDSTVGQMAYPSGGTGAKIFASTAAGSTLTNSTSVTALIGTGVGSLVIGANTLVAGSVIRYNGFVKVATNTGTQTFTLYFYPNSSGSGTGTALTFPASLTAQAAEISLTATVLTTGAGGTMQLSGRMTFLDNAGTTSKDFQTVFVNNQGVNTTVANTLDVKGQWGAASANNQFDIEPGFVVMSYP